MKYLYLVFLCICLTSCTKNTPSVKDIINKKIDTGWQQVASLPVAKAYATSFTLNSKGYVCGGELYVPQPQKTGDDHMYCYDPLSNTWQMKAGLPNPYGFIGRQDPFSFVINNQAYAGGGISSGGAGYGDVNKYNDTTDTWALQTQIAGQFALCTAAACNGKGYIFSYTNNYPVTMFDPILKTAGVARYSGRVANYIQGNWCGATADSLLYGGWNTYDYFFYFDPSNGNITIGTPDFYYASLPPQFAKNVTLNGIVYKNGIYVSFGNEGNLYRFDFVTERWQNVVNKDLGVTDGVTVFLIGNKLYVAGGNNGISTQATNKVWAIDLDAYLQ